jgi:molecular chaperone GrpE
MFDLVPEQPAEGLTAWKEQLRARFEAWLAEVETMPAPLAEPDPPDLYSLFEELAALRNESRKGNRKSAELFSQFGVSLGGFEEEMKRLRGQLTRLETAQPGAHDLPRSHCLALVEMLDRLHRLRGAMERMPPAGRLAILPPSAAWRAAWQSLRQGFDILVTHLDTLTAQTGLRPIPTAGLPFDPTSMVALDAVAASGRAANVVLEEISPGYLWRDEVLRPAEVRISKAAS